MNMELLDTNGDTKLKLTYRTLRTPPTEALTAYTRTLYFSRKSTDIVTGDVNNVCLDNEISHTACNANLNINYVTPNGNAFDDDLLHDFGGVVSVTVNDLPYSQEQEITILVPLTSMESDLAVESIVTHPVRGPIKQYVFSVGMVFFPGKAGASRIVLYDVFHFDKKQVN